MGLRTRRGPTKFDEKEIERVRDARRAGAEVGELARLHETSPQTISILTRGMYPRKDRRRSSQESRVGE